jgi:hypothetical protein
MSCPQIFMMEMSAHIEQTITSRIKEGFIPNPKLKLLDQVSEVMRFNGNNEANGAERGRFVNGRTGGEGGRSCRPHLRVTKSNGLTKNFEAFCPLLANAG